MLREAPMAGGKFHIVLALLSLGAQAMWQGRQDSVPALQLDNSSQRLRGTELSQVMVAVVGSGPISEADRALIGGAQEIYRFNSMNNLRRGERVGNVFLRRKGNMGELISGLPPSSGWCPLIENADGLLIVLDPGPPPSSNYMNYLRSKWPRAEIVEEDPLGMLEIDGTKVSPNGAGWSSGFVGAAHVLKNSLLVMQGHKVHIFGMNWQQHSVHSGGHPWSNEKYYLTNAKSIVVHPSNANNYKPRNAAGKMMWTCEGSYSILMGKATLGNNTIAVPNDIQDDFFWKDFFDDLNSSSDGIRTSAADAHLSQSRSKAIKASADDIHD